MTGILATLVMFFAPIMATAQMDHHKMQHDDMNHKMMDHRTRWGSSSCNTDEAWDILQGMCTPLNIDGHKRFDFIIHGNAFLTGVWAEKPRGKDQFAVPNMVMANIGSSVGQSQYLNLNVMLTFERWTFHEDGYSELGQTGEEDENDEPYIDAQHPHSSPIMGLTVSDTFYLGEGKDHLRLSFAPRGQSTDGPIAFMHRPTGMANPDAPLGHHLAQDAGHITSTVLGVGYTKRNTTLEISTFHGEEPKPAKVDLPIGEFDSYAVRVSEQVTEHSLVMLSAAYIKNPEGDHTPEIDHNWRYSFSSYYQKPISDEWVWNNTLVYGVINFYNGIAKLQSLNEEFLFFKKPYNIWGRFEFVERTAAELNILTASDLLKPHDLYALTFGYTHDLELSQLLHIGIGGSATKLFLPDEIEEAYNSDPVSGRVFLQLSGMWMSM